MFPHSTVNFWTTSISHEIVENRVKREFILQSNKDISITEIDMWSCKNVSFVPDEHGNFFYSEKFKSIFCSIIKSFQ